MERGGHHWCVASPFIDQLQAAGKSESAAQKELERSSSYDWLNKNASTYAGKAVVIYVFYLCTQ